MGLFKDQEKTAHVYRVVNNDVNDTLEYPTEPSATLNLHIIRIRQMERTILGDEVATYEANPDGDVRSTIFPDAKIVCNGLTYKVVGEPDYLSTIDKTKIRLVRLIEGNE